MKNRVLVSADTDFGALLAQMKAIRPSFILYRDPDFVQAEDFAAVSIRSPGALEPELVLGVRCGVSCGAASGPQIAVL